MSKRSEVCVCRRPTFESAWYVTRLVAYKQSLVRLISCMLHFRKHLVKLFKIAFEPTFEHSISCIA